MNLTYKVRNQKIERINKILAGIPVDPLTPQQIAEDDGIDWTPEDLKFIKKYVEELERIRKPFEKLFGRRFPQQTEFLKEEERTEFDNEEEAKEYKEQRQEIQEKKESFMVKKIRMKTRLAKNKLQTFDIVQAKFDLIRDMPAELVEGKIKIIHADNFVRQSVYEQDGKYMYYDSKYIFDNQNNPKPWWYDLFLTDSLRHYHIRKRHVRVAKLYIRQSLTNVFLTLTDVNNLVIYTISAGMISPANNVRVKLSASILENMIRKIRERMKYIKVSRLEIIFRSTMNEYKTILSELEKYGIKVLIISDRRISAHNGVRKRKEARK